MRATLSLRPTASTPSAGHLPPSRLSRNPFATGQTLILFLLKSIELNGTIPFSCSFSSSPPFFTIFLSLYISFFLFILFTYSLFPMFSLLLLFVLFFLSLLARYSSRGGCKMIFRNEICNRV